MSLQKPFTVDVLVTLTPRFSCVNPHGIVSHSLRSEDQDQRDRTVGRMLTADPGLIPAILSSPLSTARSHFEHKTGIRNLGVTPKKVERC